MISTMWIGGCSGERVGALFQGLVLAAEVVDAGLDFFPVGVVGALRGEGDGLMEVCHVGWRVLL